MKNHLLRIVVLLITFALGVGAVVTGRYVRGGGVGRADLSNQNPFFLVVRKRADNLGVRTACH